ncbi:MAG TPA: DNA-processing protein DprA [Nitrospirales bacterium]|jgi:DNA processing protein
MTTIGISDPRYPVSLRNIADPPPLLYVDGELEPVDAQAVAIVGSRRATPYGIRVARMLAGELSRLGFTIVSGMARGIDRVAHEIAIAAGGRTLAVLGCGLDVLYPPEHAQLRAQIAGAGAVLTEFPLGSPPLAAHFPRRNRILSGLSLGVVVVEAAEGSGSLITAKFAAEQGREVFAVPGPIDAPTSRGTHGLLKLGAKLTETVDDILDELLPQLEKPVMTASLCSASATESRRPLMDFSPEEQRVYAVVSQDPQSIDELTEQAALASSTVASALLGLELKDAVRQAPGQRYHRA